MVLKSFILLFNCLIFDNFKEKLVNLYLKFGIDQRAIDGKYSVNMKKEGRLKAKINSRRK